jgi:tetratricopeptide (TPR) repeat protein
MNRKLLGARLKERRKELKESMDSISDEFISASTVGNIERGLPNVADEKIRYYAEKIGLGRELFGILSEAEKEEKENEAELLYIEDIISADPDGSLKRLEKEFSHLQKGSRLSPLYHFLVGRCYFGKKAWDLSEQSFERMLVMIEKSTDIHSNLKAAALNDLSRICFYRSEIESALRYAREGLESFSEEGKRKDYIFYLLLNQASFLELLDKDEEALKTMERLWTYLHTHTGAFVLTMLSTDTVLQMYITFTIILNKAKHYKRALEFADEGVSIAKSNHSFDRLVQLWTTKGVIYTNMNQLEEAERFYLMALAIREKVKNKERLVYPLTQVGLLYLKKNKYEMTKKVIEESISISDKYNDVKSKIESLVILGNCYLEQGFYKEAIPSYTQASTLSEQKSLLKKQYDITTNLCYCYFKIKNNEAYAEHLQRMFRHKIMLEWGIDVREGNSNEQKTFNRTN